MTDSPKKSIDPSIVAALIGVIGTIAVTLISIYANKPAAPQPTLVPTPVVVYTDTAAPTAVPTDTVPPNQPTSTPVPATDTPEPTFTSTPVTPIPIGEDWGAGCISSLWQAYPSSVNFTDNGDGCLQEPVDVFSANDGSLSFLYERTESGPVEVHGLFAPMPESGSVTIKVQLRTLYNADLWIGMFPEPNAESKGLLLTIPAGDAKKRVITQKNVSDYKTLLSSQPFDQGTGFSFTFKFDTLSAKGTLNPSAFITNPFSIPVAKKWLFLGYKGLTQPYRIEGKFLDFQIK